MPLSAVTATTPPPGVVLVGAATPVGRLLQNNLQRAGIPVLPLTAADFGGRGWRRAFRQPMALLVAATPDSDAESVQALLDQKTPEPALVLGLSSYRVYSGDKSGFYVETDLPDAHGVADWLALEAWLRQASPHHMILRTDRPFGAAGDNVLTALLQKLLRQETFRLSSHMRGCPTAESDIARVMQAMLQQSAFGAQNWGAFHYCSGDVTHCAEFAEAVLTHARQFQSISDTVIQPLATEADRQRPVLLSCRRILDSFGIKQRSWRASLPQAVRGYFASRDVA